MRELIVAGSQPERPGLSREFCRCTGRLKLEGGLKHMGPRVATLAMHRDGVIELPPRRGPRHPRKPVVFGPDTEPSLLLVPKTFDEVRPFDLRSAVRGCVAKASADW